MNGTPRNGAPGNDSKIQIAQQAHNHETTKQELAAAKQDIENERRKWKKHAKEFEQQLLLNNEEQLAQAQVWQRIKTDLLKEIDTGKADVEMLREEMDRTIVLHVK